MSQAKQGDTVKVHYTGKLEDGTVFDSSQEREPLEFQIGEGRIIPGFEQAVEGMSTGESKTVKVASDDAYGPHRPELVQQVERSAIPDHVELEVGAQLQAQQPDGQLLLLEVVELTDDQVTLDANHPLAGKDLSFDIELLEIAA